MNESASSNEMGDLNHHPTNIQVAHEEDELTVCKQRLIELEEENEALAISEAENWDLYMQAMRMGEELEEADAQHRTTAKESAQQQRIFDQRLEQVRAACAVKVHRAELDAAVKVAKQELLVEEQITRLKEKDAQLEEKDERIRELELQNRLQQLPKVPQSTPGQRAAFLQADLQKLQLEMKALKLKVARSDEAEDVEMAEPVSKKRKRVPRDHRGVKTNANVTEGMFA